MQGTLTAIPFLIVRVTYLLLSVFHPDHNKWSALFGDIGAWIVMVLVMEYIVVWLYIGTGYRIPATGKTKVASDGYDEFRGSISIPTIRGPGR